MKNSEESNLNCKSSGCCSTEKKEKQAKRVFIEYLYLDHQTCDRCIGTDKILDEVVESLTPALRLAGYELSYDKVEIATKELAVKNKMLSSPTIRVNGRDICQNTLENDCACCGEISGTEVLCRVFEYNGVSYEVPPPEMLAEAILRNVFCPSGSECCCGEYRLPKNLQSFFAGKESREIEK